jgi:hypothetical protein
MMLTQAVVALSLLALLGPVVASAQTPSKAGVVTTLEGNVTAARSATPQPVALKFKDDVFVNDRVVTGDRSLARMLLGGKAVVTVRERSALTITEVPGHSTIELDSGKIAVAVAKDRMRPGERIEVKTPNAVAAVRGTVFVVEVIRASAGAAQPGVTTNLYTFKDVVDFTVGQQTLSVGADTFARATGIGVQTGPMTSEMRAGAVGGLSAGAPQVNGAQDAAKTSVTDATIATFAVAFPEITVPAPLPITPPQTPNPTPFPGSNSADAPSTVLTALVPATTPAPPGPGPVPGPGPLPLIPAGLVTPTSIAHPPRTSPAFGPLAAGGLVTDQYRSLGLLFGPTRVAIFDDPPRAFAGVNSQGIVDLLSPVEASFVLPGTSTRASTNRLSVEVGISDVGSILLEAFGASGTLLGSTTNDDGIGPHGRTLATLALDGIVSFRVSNKVPGDDDAWGINQIEFGDSDDGGEFLLARAVAGPQAWYPQLDSHVATDGTFLRMADGDQIVLANAREPLVWVSGGSLSVGTGSEGGNLFELIGRAGATRIDPETGLTIGTDQPIQLGAEASFVEADNAARVIVNGSAFKVDTALLEATAPLLNLRSGTVMSTTGHVVDLVGQAKVAIPNDAVAMVSLNASSLTVANGHLVNVARGSVLDVAGHLVGLANGSTMNILNGLVLNVSGGSSASIGRSLVSFSGTGNVLNVNNTIRPTAIIGGIPVAGPADSFRIGGNALAGLGAAGTININGVALTPTTPLSSLTGSLIAVQNGGTVRIGQ